jgi:hypothetical protein
VRALSATAGAAIDTRPASQIAFAVFENVCAMFYSFG